MTREDIIMIAGIVMAMIWLLFLILNQGKNRKYIIIIGVAVDTVLFIISRNVAMLLFGVLGGIVCGLFPIPDTRREYKIAVKESNGRKNWTIVSVILFVMIFMILAVTHPQIEVSL